MKPIFNQHGKPVGWLAENDVVYDLYQARGFVLDRRVFTYDGPLYLGYFEDGFFRNLSGGAVAFIGGARGEPYPPMPKKPPADISDHQPFPSKRPRFRARQGGASSKWSGESWDHFLISR